MGGMESGLDLTLTTKHYNWYIKKKQDEPGRSHDGNNHRGPVARGEVGPGGYHVTTTHHVII
eukprot:9051055-Karenia_brevis.AAC.1